MTPAENATLSGGIEIEIPGWNGEEVGVGFSSAPEPPAPAADLLAVQVSNETELHAALASQEPAIEISASFPITSTNTIQAGYDVIISSADAASPIALSRDAGFTGAFFMVTDSGKLTLQDIVVDGGGEAVAGVTGSLVEANSGTLTLNEGATLRNNVKTSGNGGAINAIVNSTVYINDGALIETNKLLSNAGSNGIGGGVYVSQSYPDGDDSKLYMAGGTIRGNVCPNGGGGLATGSRTVEVFMTGGNIIENSVTPDYIGGGVCSTGIFHFSGGKIADNIATRGGGGVYVSDGRFLMTGGEVSDNDSTSGIGWGGGFWMGAGGYLEITGGTVSDNSGNYGGAIYHEYYQPYPNRSTVLSSRATRFSTAIRRRRPGELSRLSCPTEARPVHVCSRFPAMRKSRTIARKMAAALFCKSVT